MKPPLLPLISAAFLLLLLGACSPTGGTAPPASSASSGAPARGTASGSCSLLSGSEIIGVLGGSATVSRDDVSAGYPDCNVDLTGSVWGGNGGLELQQRTYSVADYREIATTKPHVSGVQDDAVYYAARKMILFERNGIVVDLYALTDDDTPAGVVLGNLVKLARIASAHVPHQTGPTTSSPTEVAS